MKTSQSPLWGYVQIDTEFDESGKAIGGFFVPDSFEHEISAAFAQAQRDMELQWLHMNFPTLGFYCS